MTTMMPPGNSGTADTPGREVGVATSLLLRRFPSAASFFSNAGSGSDAHSDAGTDSDPEAELVELDNTLVSNLATTQE